MRYCYISIKINNGEVINLVDTYQFHLIKSPARILAPIRKYEIQKYPKSSAVEMDTRTKLETFEYTITLGYYGPEDEANSKIREFFNSFFDRDDEDNDILIAKKITLYNYWKNIQMEGYAQVWDEKTYTLQGEKGLVLFDFTVFVDDPATLMDIT